MKVPQHFIHKKCQPSPQFTMDKGNRCCSSIFFWFKFFLWLLRRKRVEKLLHSTARSNNWIMWYVKNYTLPDAFFLRPVWENFISCLFYGSLANKKNISVSLLIEFRLWPINYGSCWLIPIQWWRYWQTLWWRQNEP